MILKRIRGMKSTGDRRIAVIVAVVALFGAGGGFFALADDRVPPMAAADQLPPAPPSGRAPYDVVGPPAPGKLDRAPKPPPARVLWCKEIGLYMPAADRINANRCDKPIVCTLDAATQRYACIDDATNVAVEPPEGACVDPAFAAYYSCKKRGAAVVSTLQPDTPVAVPSPTVQQVANPSISAAVNPPVSAAATPPVSAAASPPVSAASQPPPDGNPSAVASTPPPSSATATPTPSGTGEGPVATAIDTAHAAGLQIWVERDLAGDYLAGQSQYQAGFNALVAAANRPGVTGVMFADSLGYPADGLTFTGEADVRRFLTMTAAALHRALPGKSLGVSFASGALGCGAVKTCATAMTRKAPLTAPTLITRYLQTARAAGINRAYIANGLWAATYATYGISAAQATANEWRTIRALRWSSLVELGSREYGLAHGNSGREATAADVTGQVDAARNSGIGLINVWGHRSTSGAETYQLAKITPNGLVLDEMWKALTRIRTGLSIMFDPAKAPISDIRALAGGGISEIFIKV